MSFTQKMADYISESAYNDLSSETIECTKAVVLDYLACTLAGSTASGVREVAGLARQHGSNGRSTMLVLGGRVEPMWAAMVNSVMGHALDFDDTHDLAVLHTSTVVVPAAMALAESTGASGREFLLAAALGMDLHCRLGLAATVQPAELGWIYTPLLGVFGSAAASSKLLQLNRDRTLDALGLAYSMASGNHQALNEGTLAKRLQPALASSNGILAARLSEAGLTGPHQPFEGEFGLFNVYLRANVAPEAALRDLGAKSQVDELSLKPYPCCRHNHTAIDCMVEARRRGLLPEDVAEVRLQVNSAAYAAVCEPEELKYTPQTIVDAQFSMPYAAACALAQGWVYLDDFTAEAIKRPHILKLASRVKVSIDSGLGEGDSRKITPAKAIVRMNDGSEERIVVNDPKGNPSNPMSEEEVRLKFSDCARHSAVPFDEDMLRDLTAQVMTLERASDVADLAKVLSPVMRRAPGMPN